MIKKITVGKLFGKFDYSFVFNTEGILIITGPNGYGKSTVLRMIDYLCNDSFKKLLDVSFSKLTIRCEKKSISIVKNKESFRINTISLNYLDDRPSRNRRVYIDYPRRYNAKELINLHFKPSKTEAPEEVLDVISNDQFFNQMFFELLDLETKKEASIKLKKIFEAIKTILEIKEEIGTVRFIQEQRLIEKRQLPKVDSSERHVEYVTVINENSAKLKAELSNIMQKHSSLSSELDSTYIARLFNADVTIYKNPEEISKELITLKKKQEKLQKYGLSEAKKTSEIFLTDDYQKLNKFNVELSIYLKDANAKYSVFESIIDKLDLYETIVNNKLSFKQMRLSSSNGIEVISEDGMELSLSALSSGEQEILVLFYKLIFESDVNLLLIDEPEISLHIAWQKELLSNLKSVVEFNKNIQIIIATHSPQIIAQNWDLQIDLGQQYNG